MSELRKTIFLFLLLAMNAIGMYADNELPPRDSKPIEFVPDSDSDNPRELFPVSGCYSLGNICLQFYADLGMAEITVVNQTTGATQTTMFDSAFGQAVINIGNANTSYLIYIVTEDGTTYWGTFQL